MRIGCLQFAPQLGDLDNNLNRADKILNKANPEDLDLLVLPELAFTGYNFQSLRDISPFLEPTGAGITSVWARTTALKYNTKLVVGYPEKVDVAHRWPTSPEYFNSAIIVDQNGDTIGHYRKTHLYYTDETWALEGPGFYEGHLPGLGNVAMGICMDINPYRFEAPWHAMEFAFHVLEMEANLVVLSMAWLTREDLQAWSTQSQDACMDTLTYWVTRLEPLIRAENDEEIIVVFCNRTGVEEDAVYAGTSAVIGIQNGEVTVYGMLGRGQKELLVVDTDKPGFAKLVYRPEGETEETPSDVPGAEPHITPSMETVGIRSTDATKPTDKPTPSPGLSSKGSEHPAEYNRRNSHDHIFIGSDTLWSAGPTAPRSEPVDSPVSPRYFWKQPPTHSPSVGPHDANEWQKSASATVSRNSHTRPIDRNISRSVDPEPSERFSRSVNKVANPSVTSEVSIPRPPSTKSRNVSRQRSEKVQPVKIEDPLGVGRNWDQDEKVVVPLGIAPEFQEPLSSLDLEKLGADLMVFEGAMANRVKRDSLVCHVDEDDYIILRTERKDSGGKKKPSKSDAPAGRSSSRNQPKSGDSSKRSGSRSHSRSNKGSPPNPSPTKDWSARPESRGRRRGDSRTSPKDLSKKASHGHVTPNGGSPAIVSDAWGSKPEPNHHSRHTNGHRSAVASPPLPRHRHDPMPSTNKPVRHKSPEESNKHEMTVPVKMTRHRKGDSRSSNSMAPLSSPEAAVTSPKKHASPTTRVPEAKTTAPKFIPEMAPPTPKAMILPPDYQNATNHHSLPALPKQQVVPLKCLDKSTRVLERPKSAVW